MNKTTKQALTHSFLHSASRTINLVREMEEAYLNAVERRNDATFPSTAYEKAEQEVERIEREASRLIFGKDHALSFSQCLEEADLMQSEWETRSSVFMAGMGRPHAVEKGTDVYRYRGSWVVLRFRIENGQPTLWFLHVPESVIVPQTLGF